MKKFMVIAIPVLTLCIFISVMLSGNFLKKPFGQNDNVPRTIEAMIEDVNNDDWEELNGRTDDLQFAWKKVVSRIQFSSERDEINSFSTNIARLRGAVIARDKAGALSELKEAYMHWEQLGH